MPRKSCVVFRTRRYATPGPTKPVVDEGVIPGMVPRARGERLVRSWQLPKPPKRADAAATTLGRMNHTTTALVTGANKGIGYETARRLAARGMTVLVGARDR